MKKISNHTTYVCSGNHEGWKSCQFCDGDLFACSVCGSFEGATTTDCPGYRLNQDCLDKIYAGNLDYRFGEFMSTCSPHSPAYYMEKNDGKK